MFVAIFGGLGWLERSDKICRMRRGKVGFVAACYVTPFDLRIEKRIGWNEAERGCGLLYSCLGLKKMGGLLVNIIFEKNKTK
jgi:hypothetical protein